MMKTADGVRPAYNVQAAVDSESQVVVAANVTEFEVDHGQLAALLEEVRDNTGLSPGVVLADSGYCDEETLRALAEANQAALIPPSGQPRCRNKERPFSSDEFVLDQKKDVVICPMGKELQFRDESRRGSGTYRRYAGVGCKRCQCYGECVPDGRASRRVSISVVAEQRRAMRDRIASEEGKMLSGLRKQIVEPVFGQVKNNIGFNRFLLRGLAGAKAECALVMTGHNLMKWVRSRQSATFSLFLKSIRSLMSAVRDQTQPVSASA